MESLKEENSRLREQLKIQEKICQKLKNEKDRKEEELTKALEEVSRLKEELESSKAVMKQFREEKEKEIQQLRMMKQELELRVRVSEDDLYLGSSGGMATEAPGAERDEESWTGTSRNETTLNSADMALAFSDWEGVEDIVNLFKEETTEIPNWSPEMHVNWSLCMKLYISAPEDMEQAAKMFIENHMDHLKLVCQEGGCTLVPVYIQTGQEHLVMSEEQLLDVCRGVCQTCHIFVALLGTKSDDQTKLEYEHGYLNSIGRPAIFFFHNNKKSCDAGTERLISRVKKARKFAKIIETAKSIEEGLQWVAVQVEHFLHKELKVLHAADITDEYKLKHIGYIQDMRNELEQEDLIKNINSLSSGGLYAYDKCFEALSGYMMNDSSTPLLIVGGPGTGKSTILAKWLESLLTSAGADNMLVLQHFVSTSGSNTADPSIIIRRFMHKLKYCHPDFGEIPTAMMERFSHWLSLAASQRLDNASGDDFSHLIIIAIDSAHLIVNWNRLSFLVESLPVNVKVILTVTDEAEETYPQNWRLFNKFFLHNLTNDENLKIATNILDESKSIAINDLQISSLILTGPVDPSPLWCSMATRHAISAAAGVSESEVDDIIDTVMELEEITDLCVHIFEDLSKRLGELAPQLEQDDKYRYHLRKNQMNIVCDKGNFDRYAVKVLNNSERTQDFIFSSFICIHTKSVAIHALQLIYWSRNGIMLSELLDLCDINVTTWCFIYHILYSKHTLMEIGGLITFKHDQVMEAHESLFCGGLDVNHMMLCTDTMLEHYSHTDKSNVLMSRRTEEVPYHLKRAERKQELEMVLLDIDLLILMHYSGRSNEMLLYWEYCDQDKDENAPAIANKYYKTLRNLEDLESSQELLVFASLYTTLGVILSKMGLLNEAKAPLQRALEIYESLLDPDSSEVGLAMYQLGSLYQKSGNHVSAESMLNQALLITESSYGAESEECLKVLEALIMTYEKLETPDIADSLRTRVHAIIRNLEKKASKPKALDVFANKVQELEDLVQQPESVMVAQAMNQLAVVYCLLGDIDNSLLFFGKSYDICSRLMGERSHEAIVMLKNMGTYYANLNNLETATALNKEVYEVLLELYPNGHDLLTKTIIELANYYRELDHLEEAAVFQKEVVAVKEKEYGADHPSVAMELNNMAVSYCHLGQFSEALPLYERALSIYEEFYGMDHELTLNTISNLTKLKKELGNSDHMTREYYNL